MRRRLALVLVCALLAVSLSGCWSYRGLNELALVMGMSLDKDFETDTYKISCEIADLAKASGDSGIGSKIVEAEGRSIFEAIRNAKRKLVNKLYFGNMGTVVFGEEFAREEGIGEIINWLLGDGEIRETIDLCVAIGTKGSDLLKIEGLDQSIVAIEIANIISEDAKITSSTVATQLYQAFDALECPGQSLVLPAFRIVKNDGADVVEASGAAIFDEDKVVGFLNSEQAFSFLAVTDELKGGIIVLPQYVPGTKEDVSLEIADSKAKTSFKVVDEKLVFHVEIETTVYLSQVPDAFDVLDEKQITELEERAGAMIAGNAAALIGDVQETFKTDIFGLGRSVHRHDLDVWRQIECLWKDMFPTVTVAVSGNVEIVNTASTFTKGAMSR